MAAFDFSGKTVLVTGASRGIGYAIACGFAEAGADLAVLAEDEGIIASAASLAERYGRAPLALRCDITERAAVRDVIARMERIDVLINNAGLELITPIDATDPEAEDTFARIIDINVLGTYYVTRSALPRMPRGSRIVVTASIWSKTAVAGFSAYCASKHANLGFVRSLAQELGPRGIMVNAVCPGFIETEAALRSVKSEARRTGLSEDDVTRDLLRNQALPGLLKPAEVVPAFLFLASDLARDITGQSIHVDRGDVMD
jgi:NAD(P)-dependent dehydrogenase (short-subunit alcohol dehydrogenase family)